MTTLADIQNFVGVKADGKWGEQTAAAIADALGLAKADDLITTHALLALIGHEAIVQEAYKDSVGVWTWAIGITSASGHKVERYKDNPQSLEKCLSVFIWLIRNKYAPEVLAAFKGRTLTEAQFAAALSFHYNTGAISRASWVKSWLDGKPLQARKEFMEWRKPPEIVARREAERDLFFDGRWPSMGMATIYPVKKPSYAPDWRAAKRIDIREALRAAMAVT